ncbi:F0F1 ATP synthase subunit I [Salmonella enterica subsp. enterica serovar Typhi]|nr:F0F1 ATP synthase subunit I [Salmonella enterica subsp. enterica serovar Typhi]EEJ5880432.1 F0F1 ATP synthase subunit I [Salmonella enterica]
MPVSLVSRNVARKLLFIQFLAVIASGLLFCLKDPFWGISAVCGGLAVALPNMLFMIFAWRHQAHTPAKGRFAFGEAFKVLAMLVLLVVALAVLKAVFLPLIVTWVLVLVVQILAPAVINNKG